jgi:fumarate reductase subunit D
MVGVITTRRMLYSLAAMVVLLVVGTIIGLIWADTSNVAGAFAGVTNVISALGIVLLLILLAVRRRRRLS